MYCSPRYRVALDPASASAFRIQSYEAPESAALRSVPTPGAAPVAVTRPAPAADRLELENAKDSSARKVPDAELKNLIDRFQSGSVAGRVVGILPVTLPFPALGPSLYLASELTPEGTAPEIRLLLKEITLKGAAR